MNVQLPIRMDTPAFLDWMQGREGRYELSTGNVVMVPGASRGHGIIVMRLAAWMMARLDSQTWTVLVDFGVDIGPDTLRYPDIVVDRAGASLRDLTTATPTFVVEVLSPSTQTVDLGEKARDYLSLPSLDTYLVLAQNEPKAWLWSRGTASLASVPLTIAGLDKTIALPALGLSLPLTDIYSGIT